MPDNPSSAKAVARTGSAPVADPSTRSLTVISGPEKARTSILRSALPTSPPGSRTTVRMM